MQALGTSNPNSIPTAQANPLSSDSYSLYPGSTLSTRGVPKQVQKVDFLGNKLWLPDGKPKMTTIYVEEPASASVQYQQIPQTPAPNLSGGQTFTQPPQPVAPQQDPPVGGGNRGSQGNQGGNQGRGNIRKNKDPLRSVRYVVISTTLSFTARSWLSMFPMVLVFLRPLKAHVQYV